jgi:hypothetical protein
LAVFDAVADLFWQKFLPQYLRLKRLFRPLQLVDEVGALTASGPSGFGAEPRKATLITSVYSQSKTYLNVQNVATLLTIE